MKNLSAIFGTAALVGSMAFFAACNGNKGASTATNNTATPSVGGEKIAYVNIDSLEAHYELLKTKKDEFKKKQDNMEGELQKSYQQMQNDADEVQKKIQAGTIQQAEYDAAQKRLMQMQQSLETRKQALTEQLMKEQEDFNKDLKSRLDAFIADYNKSKGYDFILSYSNSGSSSILYANKQYDITKDVIDGMNAASKTDADQKK